MLFQDKIRFLTHKQDTQSIESELSSNASTSNSKSKKTNKKHKPKRKKQLQKQSSLSPNMSEIDRDILASHGLSGMTSDIDPSPRKSGQKNNDNSKHSKQQQELNNIKEHTHEPNFARGKHVIRHPSALNAQNSKHRINSPDIANRFSIETPQTHSRVRFSTMK